MRMLAMNANAAFTPLEMFANLGQSNMSGRGLISELPVFANAARIKNFSNAWQWIGAAEPIDSALGQIDAVSSDTMAGVGPAMSFANALAAVRPGVDIGLIPCAKSGSYLSEWSRNLSRATLYGSAVARMLKAAETGTLKGILWYQGESETQDMGLATTVTDRTLTLFANLRSDLGIPALPIVATILAPNTGRPYWSIVQDQIAAISGEKIAVVTAADLPTKVGDELHLGTASQITLGQRYATAMQSLL